MKVYRDSISGKIVEDISGLKGMEEIKAEHFPDNLDVVLEELEYNETKEDYNIVDNVLTKITEAEIIVEKQTIEDVVETKRQAIRDATTIAGLRTATLDYLGIPA